MAIMLSQLCENTAKSYNLKLIAGQDGLENPVRWVHMIEDSDVTGFIHGNELVFTTGIRQHGTDWILNFVTNLRENGAVGLVLNIGPYITSIPPQVIVFCEKNSFPLFTLPWDIHIIDVTYDFCHRIIKNEENETTIASAFKNLIFSPEKREGYQNSMLRGGFHNESLYTVMAISISKDNQKRPLKTSELIKKHQFELSKILRKSQFPVCVFIQENFLIVIRQKSSQEEINEISETLEKILGENEKINIGISTSSNGWLSVPNLYSEAVSAGTVAAHQNKTFMNYKDIGVYKLLFGVRDTSILSDYVESTLGELIFYDKKNSTDYMKTLKLYLENDCSVQCVATLMNVHRNTINYKMKMIREILKTELHDSEKMNFLLAFRVGEMLGTI